MIMLIFDQSDFFQLMCLVWSKGAHNGSGGSPAGEHQSQEHSDKL